MLDAKPAQRSVIAAVFWAPAAQSVLTVAVGPPTLVQYEARAAPLEVLVCSSVHATPGGAGGGGAGAQLRPCVGGKSQFNHADERSFAAGKAGGANAHESGEEKQEVVDTRASISVNVSIGGRTVATVHPHRVRTLQSQNANAHNPRQESTNWRTVRQRRGK